MHDRAPANLKYLLPLQESRLLTISLDGGKDGQALADSLGASALLDKVYLADELIPAILNAGRVAADEASAVFDVAVAEVLGFL